MIPAGLLAVAFFVGYLAGAVTWHSRLRTALEKVRALQATIDRAWHAADVAARCSHAMSYHYGQGAAWAARVVARALEGEHGASHD